MEPINNNYEITVPLQPVIQLPLTKDQLESSDIVSSGKAFIEANTLHCSFRELSEDHILPVWAKDNEPLISHADFIEHTCRIVKDVFHGEQILQPSIRISHPIKGRIPEAKSKPADMLEEHEKTLWYERMMFCVEIPSIQAEVDGNALSLTIGGVKSFSEDNLYQNSNGDQHFQIFIGFKNRVCTNLCVWSDGLNSSIAVKGLSGLIINIHSLLKNYNSGYHLHHLQTLAHHFLTEAQFAHMIGRCRIFHHLPHELRKGINPILLGDQQIGSVVRGYYRDKNFRRNENGEISLWKLYNLLTGTNKTSYIDSFLDRSVNAYNFVEDIKMGLDKKRTNWYLP